MADARRGAPSTAEELRGLTRDAHAAAKDLRAAIREARAVAPTIVGDLIEAEVKRQVDRLGEATEEAMRRSVAKVSSEFDRLADMYMGRTSSARRRGDRPLAELAERFAQRKAEEADGG